MNPWVVVGLLLNVGVGVRLLSVDLLGLSASTSLSKLLVHSDTLTLFRVGILCWLLALLLSIVGVVLILIDKKRWGAHLVWWGGLAFFPIGLVLCKGASILLDELKHKDFQAAHAFEEDEGAIDSAIFRVRWRSHFDVVLGSFLSIGAIVLVYYTNVQHFYTRLPDTVPSGVLNFSRPDLLSSTYVTLGMVMLLSSFVLLWSTIALAAQSSMWVLWNVWTTAFLPGPLMPFVLLLGLLLLLAGISSIRKPLLQLHEHYFTLRPHFVGRTRYILYKDIEHVEEKEGKRLFVQFQERGRTRSFELSMDEAERPKRKQLIRSLQQRKELQHQSFA